MIHLSERISRNRMKGEPLEEQKLINKSLIALSRIVQNLSNEYDNITYAPYHDSKLTRIISDYFGGNGYTSLILSCSKHEISAIETRNTLMFGEKCKKIKNNPSINLLKKVDQNMIMEDIFGIKENKSDLDFEYYYGKINDFYRENGLASDNKDLNKKDKNRRKKRHNSIEKYINNNKGKWKSFLI